MMIMRSLEPNLLDRIPECVQRRRAAFVRRVEEYEERKVCGGRIPGCEPSDAFEFGGPLSDDDVLCMGCAQRAKNDSKE